MKKANVLMAALLGAAVLLSGCGKSAEDALGKFAVTGLDRYSDYDELRLRKGLSTSALERALKTAAKTDMQDPRVQARVGICRLFGIGCASDEAGGVSLLEKAANDVPFVRDILLRHHLEKRDMVGLGRCASRFAEKGDTFAGILLARLQLTGEGGVAKDVPAARARLRRILSAGGDPQKSQALSPRDCALLEDAALLLFGSCLEDQTGEGHDLCGILLSGIPEVECEREVCAELYARLGARMLEGRDDCPSDLSLGLDVLTCAAVRRRSGLRESLWATRAAWWAGVMRCAGPAGLRDYETGLALLEKALRGTFASPAEKDAVRAFYERNLSPRRQKQIFGQTLGTRLQSDSPVAVKDGSRGANDAEYVYTDVLPYDRSSRREVAGWEFPWTFSADGSFRFDRKDYVRPGSKTLYRVEMSWEVPRNYQPGKYLRKIRDEVRAYFNAGAPVEVEAPWHGDSDATTILVWDLEMSRVQLAFRKGPSRVVLEREAVMTFSIQLKDEHGRLVGELQDAYPVGTGTNKVD